MRSKYRPRGIHVQASVQRIGRETLVYDGERHRAYCLNESSGVVWRLADGSRTVAEIGAAAGVELGVEVSRELVDFILGELGRDGLLEAGDEEQGEVRAGISRRAMLQRLGVGGAMLLPAIGAIVAPTAAQAYGGCVDCDASQARAAKVRRAQQNRAAGTSPE